MLPISKLKIFLDLEHSTIAGTSTTFTGVVTTKPGMGVPVCAEYADIVDHVL